MPHSFARVAIHLTYSTKDRHPWITNAIRGELNAYQIGILRKLGCPSIRTNAATDHAHNLFIQSKRHALDYIVEELKGSSSKWIKTKGVEFAEFYWQPGYAAFSVSEEHIERVAAYIDRQVEHHRRVTFEEEIRQFFKQYGLKMDEHFFE